MCIVKLVGWKRTLNKEILHCIAQVELKYNRKKGRTVYSDLSYSGTVGWGK